VPAAAEETPWALYLLECAGDRTYLGISPTPEQRFKAHAAGRGSMFTRLNRPQRIAHVVWFGCRRHAAVMERKLKARPAAEKRAWLELWQARAEAGSLDFESAHHELTAWLSRR
jgi:putative endonuclease